MSKYPYPPEEYDYGEFDDTMNTGSASDCTGLIPSAAVSESEYDSYEDLYDFLPNIPESGYR